MTRCLCKLITRCRSQWVVRDAVVYKKVGYVACFVDLVSSEHPQMAVQLVITISFLLLLTYGLAEAAPIPQPGCKTRLEKLVFHTRLESDPVVTWTIGSKLFAMELEPS